MIIEIDDMSGIPIYQQIRNQIVEGISRRELLPGDSLPSVRALAEEIGINSMTVNKTYQILKQEGYLVIDRRRGARVAERFPRDKVFSRENQDELRRIVAEAMISGITREELLEECARFYDQLSQEAEKNVRGKEL